MMLYVEKYVSISQQGISRFWYTSQTPQRDVICGHISNVTVKAANNIDMTKREKKTHFFPLKCFTRIFDRCAKG